jgi:Nuclease A inhibitor-like protein
METGTQTNYILEPSELKTALADKIQGLLFPSESDRPIEVASSEDSADIKNQMVNHTADSNNEPVSGSISFEDFYNKYGTQKEWQNDAQKKFADQFGSALELLRANLTDVCVVRRGQVEITILVGGQAENGEWIGLKTTAVETGE